MKIASYNIMSGGFNSYESISSKPEKLLLLQKAIKTINADFIGLVDTFRWGEVFTFKRLKELFGYQEVVQADLEDNRVEKRIGITVLSRLSLNEFGTVRLYSRNAVRSQLKINGKEIEIFTVYLDDLSEETRLNQIKALLGIVNKPSVIMGDFNAVCKEDVPEIKLKWHKFLKLNPKFKESKDYESYFVPVFDELIRGEVVEKIKQKGFREAANNGIRQMTFPTPVFMNVPTPYLKVDHLFYTPDLSIDNFQVLTGGIFNQASDHYPVVGELGFL